jgi:hypothetical protein
LTLQGTRRRRRSSNFRRAHENGNYAEYEKLLADDFTFVFAPQDVHPDTPWSDGSWGRSADLASAEELFGKHRSVDGLVMNQINLQFSAGQPEVSPENSQWQRVVLSEVDLAIAATKQSTGEAWQLLIPGGYQAHLDLVQTGVGGESPVWKIIRWEDRPPAAAAASASVQLTWGGIKIRWCARDGYPAATTPEQLFENFKRSYREMDYDEYAKLLDEDFIFAFDPRDVGPDRPWHEATWTRSEELQSAGNMFGGEPNLLGQFVDGIALDYDAGDLDVSPVDDDWQRSILTRVDLTVYTTEELTGDQWILRIPGGYEAHLHILETEQTDPWTGESLWKIIRWDDKPPMARQAGPVVDTTTWGSIKILFL